MGRRPIHGTLCVALVAAIGGCGSSSKHMTTSSAVDRVVRSAIAAARQLHSYHVHANVIGPQGHVTIDLELNGPTQVRMTERRTSGTLQVITFGGYTYILAPLAYWSSAPNLTPAEAHTFAGRWVRIPTTDSPGLAVSEQSVANLGKLAQCWLSREPDLSIAGTTTVAGHGVVIMASRGSLPGSSPGRTYVSTIAPKLPLKVVIDGPAKPGGPAACLRSTVISGVETLGGFNQHFPISAPAGAIALR